MGSIIGPDAPHDYTGATIHAAGTTQGTATPITTDTVSADTPSGTAKGVILPASPGFARIFVNHTTGATALDVYPPVGGTINALAANAAFTVGVGAQQEFWSTDAGNLQWYTR